MSEALEESFANIDETKTEEKVEESAGVDDWEYKIPFQPPSGFQDSLVKSRDSLTESPIQASTKPFLQEASRPVVGGDFEESLTYTKDVPSLFSYTSLEAVNDPGNIQLLHKMQFSIDSYDSRERKEAPYVKKLSRTESMNSRYGAETPTSVEAEQARASLPPHMNATPIREEEEAENESFERVLETTQPLILSTGGRKDSLPVYQARPLQPHERSVSPVSPKPAVPPKKPGLLAKPASFNKNNNKYGSIGNLSSSGFRKSGLQSDRVMPNDDLVLNLRRKQSFGSTAARGPVGNGNLRELRAKSMVNLDSAEDMRMRLSNAGSTRNVMIEGVTTTSSDEYQNRGRDC